MVSIAERHYLIIKRRGLAAKVIKYLYFIMLKPRWMSRSWARGEKEWSTRMYDEQLGDLL